MFTTRQQMTRALDAGRLAELERRAAEHRLELPDELERRDSDLARDVSNGDRDFTLMEQQVPRTAQATEAFVSEQHVWYYG